MGVLRGICAFCMMLQQACITHQVATAIPAVSVNSGCGNLDFRLLVA